VSVLAAALVFLSLAWASYSAMSLAGSVLAEKARRDGIAAVARANAARTEQALLEKRLDAITSLKAVDAWAIQNGFVAPDRVLRTSLMASRD
jgi:hypothetical protein